MSSDLLKRERIREALTARLLQLSRQCDEICSSSNDSLPKVGQFTNENTSQVGDFGSGVFKIGFPIPLRNVPSNESGISSEGTEDLPNSGNNRESLIPLMINNYVTPSLISLEPSMEQNTEQSLQTQQSNDKAFCKDIVFTRHFSLNTKPACEEGSVPRDSPDLHSSHLEDDGRLFIPTPSTDLDQYMDRSDTSFKSQSIRSASSLSDRSTESETDHVTVVSLTSDTESQESLRHSDSTDEHLRLNSDHPSVPTSPALLTSNMNEPIPKVLNELPNDSQKIDSVEPEIVASEKSLKTPRRRRLSYTLESPSPILQKALNTHSVGPESEKTDPKQYCRPKSNSLKGYPSLQIAKPSSQLVKNEGSSMKVTNIEKPVGYLTYRSRIPIMSNSKPKRNPVVLGYDKQLVNIGERQQSLRRCLERLNSSLSPYASPRHERRDSIETGSSSSTSFSASLTTRAPTLPVELQTLREELSQQRNLLTELTQRFQELSLKQDVFFSQLLSAQQKQMTDLQNELSRQVYDLVSQHSLQVQQRLCSMENSLRAVSETGHQNNQGTGPRTDDVTDSMPIKQIYSINEEQQVSSQSSDAEDCRRVMPLSTLSSPEMKAKFDKVSAAVKGYLTRRLLKTEKVQGLIQTIKDTMECALKLHEVARNNGVITSDDAELHQRLIIQVTSSCHAFHDVFFKYSVEEQMHLIAQSRQLVKEKVFKANRNHVSGPYISSATVKTLERKQFAKSRSVSPNAGRKKWKEPKRPSTGMEYPKGTKFPPRRNSSLTPTKDRLHRKSVTTPTMDRPHRNLSSTPTREKAHRNSVTTPTKDRPHRNLSSTPTKERPRRLKQAKGDCRSPSFYF